MSAQDLNEVIGWHRAAMAKQEHWRALKAWAWVMAHDPSQGTHEGLTALFRSSGTLSRLLS